MQRFPCSPAASWPTTKSRQVRAVCLLPRSRAPASRRRCSRLLRRLVLVAHPVRVVPRARHSCRRRQRSGRGKGAACALASHAAVYQRLRLRLLSCNTFSLLSQRAPAQWRPSRRALRASQLQVSSAPPTPSPMPMPLPFPPHPTPPALSRLASAASHFDIRQRGVRVAVPHDGHAEQQRQARPQQRVRHRAVPCSAALQSRRLTACVCCRYGLAYADAWEGGGDDAETLFVCGSGKSGRGPRARVRVRVRDARWQGRASPRSPTARTWHTA